MSPAAEAVVDRQVEREQSVSLVPAAPPPPPPPPPPEAKSEKSEPPAAKPASTRGGATLEFAVFGGLLAGAAGIVKATQMQRPEDILLCLLGSFTGCGLVCYFYFRRE